MIDLPTAPLHPDQLNSRGIADALDRAAQLIADNGLTTGEYWTGSLFATSWTPGRGCCAVGAIGVATGYRDLNEIDTVHPALTALMRYRGWTDPLDVMNWSDNTAERDVVQELRACAAHLRIHADDSDLDRIAAGEPVTTDLTTVELSLAQQAGAVTT